MIQARASHIEKFRFEPLAGAFDFRVLKLHPASSQSDPIHFTVEKSILRAAPEYHSISYTWDGQVPEQEAYANRDSFPITKNCRDILLRLRPRNSTFILWIDQICIDHSSDEDRSYNVKRMGYIQKLNKRSNLDRQVWWRNHTCTICGVGRGRRGKPLSFAPPGDAKSHADRNRNRRSL